jgi:4-diphosphocytidyl-2-C-methyl-D-erythritol kinase
VQNAPMSHAHHAQISSEVCFTRAYAKINLTLDVLNRRPDGYHQLATVMQTVDLHDTICLTITNDQRVQLDCNNPALSNNDNLAARAAEMVRQRFALRQGVRIELYKRIPVAAGLGGGSSDAASVLRALQQWLQLPLSPSALLSMAASLGSDVPFFLTGGLALCEGRGEQVTFLSQRWPASLRWLLLLKPAISLSTAAVFRDLPASDYTDGTYSRTLCSALQAGSSLQLEHLHNSLERDVLERYPAVAQAKDDLISAGASVVRLSGSGPTLYAPFAELSAALQVLYHVQSLGYEVYLSRAINSNPGDLC